MGLDTLGITLGFLQGKQATPISNGDLNVNELYQTVDPPHVDRVELEYRSSSPDFLAKILDKDFEADW